MNQYEYYRDIQLSGGTLLAVAVTGETDATITTPDNEYEFFNQVQLDEQGRLKIYIKEYLNPSWEVTVQPYPICVSTGTTFTLYTSDYVLGNGIRLFSDSNLTIPFVGDPDLFYTFAKNGQVWCNCEVDSNGYIFQLAQNCITYYIPINGDSISSGDACSDSSTPVIAQSFTEFPNVGDIIYWENVNLISKFPGNNNWWYDPYQNAALQINDLGKVLAKVNC
jgi:hypothetical protein